MFLAANCALSGHASWRVAILHPDPEPIIEVVRALPGFSPVHVVADDGLRSVDDNAAVWIVHRNYLADDSFLSRLRVRAPVVIAVSQTDGSAEEWFARGVFDFLLEPVEEQRLHTALRRAHHYLEPLHALDALRTLGQRQSLVALLTPRRVLFVTAAEIDWAQAATNGVTVCARARQYPVRESLADFAARLPPNDFVRLRRSLIVSLRCLKAVESRGHGELTVTLKGGRRIPVGPTYRHGVEQLIDSAASTFRPA